MWDHPPVSGLAVCGDFPRCGHGDDSDADSAWHQCANDAARHAAGAAAVRSASCFPAGAKAISSWRMKPKESSAPCCKENLTGVRVVRAFGREQYEDEKV